jgi:hypothetical protein
METHSGLDQGTRDSQWVGMGTDGSQWGGSLDMMFTGSQWTGDRRFTVGRIKCNGCSQLVYD